MAVRTALTTPITRDDLEAKFRELEGEARDQVASARTTLIMAGGIAAFIVLLLVFLLGRRAGKQRSTIVEIRRV
ncbi:MAG TPA: hypothetical protein VE623_04495 [Acidimicrobiales bacterium]|nr:hypothetical protein [Acidimicrobiales bacterium]